MSNNIQLAGPIIAIVLLLTSCSRSLVTQVVTTTDEAANLANRSVDTKQPCDCQDYEHYLPRAELAAVQDIKIVRTAFIFPDDSTSAHNWSGHDAVEYAKHLLYYGNEKMKKNRPMLLPVGNTLPVYPIPWRYQLAASDTVSSGYEVYEVIDDQLAYFVSTGKDKNNYDGAVIRKHAKSKGEQLNIFAMVHHPDSVSSTTYNDNQVGIALGSAIKIADVTSTSIVESWKLATLLNHEVGHVMGLRHSWNLSDGCDDTPSHPNCFQEGPGKCKVISNNMMDYNRIQAALTPCQVGIATYNLHSERSTIRKLLVKDWCDIDHSKPLLVTDSLHIDRAVDLKGNIIVSAGAVLKISCRVHMPANAKIMVAAGGKLILNGCKLHNDCGEQWGGIELIHKGNKKAVLESYGRVTISDTASDQLPQHKT